MSIEIVKAEIMRFLASKEPEVLCISGKWGVGKTYSWKQFLKNARNNNSIAFERYAYVSLFGINSLDDLKNAIFENTVPKDKIEAGANYETFQMMLEEPEVLGRKTAHWLIKLTEKLPYLKYLNLGSMIRFFSVLIRNQIICIDDLDRKGKNLEVNDVLGLINFLKEERNCKIVLVFDEDALYNAIPEENKKGEFRKYFEKIVDVFLKFEPTARESIKIALEEQTNENHLISENCIKLNISNIRIIRKIERLIKQLTPLLMDYDEQVLIGIIKSIVLLGWCVYASGTNAPPLDYVKNKNKYADVLKKDENLSKEEAAWNAILDAYGFYYMDAFDILLLEGVQNGYFDYIKIQEEALKVHDRIRAENSTKSFWKSWELYHNSFENNQVEVIDNIYKSFKENIQHIYHNDLNGTVCLFKELGATGKARELIDYYVNNRQGGKRFWDLDYYTGHKVDDPDVIKAIKDKCASFKEDIDPNELLIEMADNRGWDNEKIEKASKLPEEIYVDIFKSQKGDNLHAIINFCLQFDNIANASEEMKKIAERAKNALREIGKESKINALRVSRYIG
jgi:hypothetical protein